MSGLGRASRPRGRADGGGPGGEGGRCSADGGTWLTPSALLFDVVPSDGAKRDRGHNVRHQSIAIFNVHHLYDYPKRHLSSSVLICTHRK